MPRGTGSGPEQRLDQRNQIVARHDDHHPPSARSGNRSNPARWGGLTTTLGRASVASHRMDAHKPAAIVHPEPLGTTDKDDRSAQMSINTRHSRRTVLGAGATSLALTTTTACSGPIGPAANDSDEVTIQFAQWWAPELPEGAFTDLIEQFEEDNPGINVELISSPYSSTQEQLFAGSASGTMPDVMGLDGVWVHDFAQQGSIADLSALMDEHGYDDSRLASQVKVDGSTYMIPVVNFIYPLFTNDDLLAQAGIESPPTNRAEFQETAEALAGLGGDVTGWALPLSLEQPNGANNEIMSWLWASGGSMLADGRPDVTNEGMLNTVEYIQEMWNAGAVAPGSFTMKEQDKVEEFTNGRVGTMISSTAHINLLRETNPELGFSISPVPPREDFDGESGAASASWGVGISENTENPEECWRLVEFLLGTDINAELSDLANGFPGNTDSVPNFVEEDALMARAFEIYQTSRPTNEFSGLPTAEDLMRTYVRELQTTLEDKQSPEEMLDKIQSAWSEEF